MPLKLLQSWISPLFLWKIYEWWNGNKYDIWKISHCLSTIIVLFRAQTKIFEYILASICLQLLNSITLNLCSSIKIFTDKSNFTKTSFLSIFSFSNIDNHPIPNSIEICSNDTSTYAYISCYIFQLIANIHFLGTFAPLVSYTSPMSLCSIFIHLSVPYFWLQFLNFA